MKSAISIVAFTVTFGFSVLLVGLLFGFPQTCNDYARKAKLTACHDKSCHNIERLINQDIRNGELRDYKIRYLGSSTEKLSLSEYTDFVNKYVDKSESMDDSGLPSDFQASWRRHMKAWRDYSDFLNEQKYASERLSETELIEYEREFNTEISRTWYQTLRIGRSYGASFDL